MTISGEQPGRVEYPSVGVELMLVGGTVADADGPAVGIARPIVERSFVTRMFAVKREENRKTRAIEPARVQQPREKRARLSVLAGAEERADADARVAWPRVAVVPVADPAELFRQRSRRCGDRCTRWRVGQQPKREQATHNGITERQVRVDLLRPCFPTLLVGLEQRPGGVRVDVHKWLTVRDGKNHGERAAWLHRYLHRSPDFEWELRTRRERGGERSPAAGNDAATRFHARSGAGLSEARVELDDGVDRPSFRNEPTHENGRWEQPTLELGDHPFHECQPRAIRFPGGLERRSAVLVLPPHDPFRADGSDPKETGRGPADEAAEDRVAVEAGYAHPVDRSVGRDERGRAGIANESVVADRPASRRGHVNCAFSSRPSAIPNATCDTIATSGVRAP